LEAVVEVEVVAAAVEVARQALDGETGGDVRYRVGSLVKHVLDVQANAPGAAGAGFAVVAQHRAPPGVGRHEVLVHVDALDPHVVDAGYILETTLQHHAEGTDPVVGGQHGGQV